MRPKSLLFAALSLAALPLCAQWVPVGDMPRPARAGNALRFANAQAVATITALSAEVIRVRVTRGGREWREHADAVVHRNPWDPGAGVGGDGQDYANQTSC